MLRAVKQAGQWVADGWPIGGYLAMMAKCAIAKGLQRERVRYIFARHTAHRAPGQFFAAGCCRLEAMVLTLSVKHGQSTYQLTETEDAGVSMLM